MSFDPWRWAAERLRRFLLNQPRLSHLLEGLPAEADRTARRRALRLLVGTVRHLGLIEHCLSELVPKRPRAGLRAGLLIAGYELMETPQRAAPIVSHAVDRIGRAYSAPERRLANAVLRRLPERIAAARRLSESSGPDALAVRFSHPRWLVERWLAAFGREATLEMLEADQEEPVFFAWKEEGELPGELASGLKESEEAPGFWRAEGESWPRALEAAEAGLLYIQNPSAAEAADWLGEAVGQGRVALLDLCAAPGGKTLRLRRRLSDRLERLVAVDLPGPRLERMAANFERRRGFPVKIVAGDVRELDPGRIGRFDGVLLDAPCSNTGVLRRKPDVKWRLAEADIPKLADLQGELLRAAAALVRPGGRLLYSVCSVEPEENEGVIEAFAEARHDAFALVERRLQLPDLAGRDGAGLTLFRRIG